MTFRHIAAFVSSAICATLAESRLGKPPVASAFASALGTEPLNLSSARRAWIKRMVFGVCRSQRIQLGSRRSDPHAAVAAELPESPAASSGRALVPWLTGEASIEPMLWQGQQPALAQRQSNKGISASGVRLPLQPLTFSQSRPKSRQD